MRYLALVLVILTWCLILVGGVVHGTGSSLACPDWPTCYGTFFPEMQGGVFFEHSHRILATLTGFLTILLCIGLLWKGEGKLKKMGLMALALVIFQGILGGLTVIYRLPTAVSTAHLATSMLFLSLLVWISFILFQNSLNFSLAAGSFSKWVIPTLGLVYFQIVLGAFVRHTGAGLACPEIPLCQGTLWPFDAMPIVKFQMFHRLMGIVVALAVIVASIQVYRSASSVAYLKVLAFLAPILVLVQIALGLWSVHSLLGLFPVTAHLGIAALILVDFVLISLISVNLKRRAIS